MRLPLQEVGRVFRQICKRAAGQTLGLVIVCSIEADSVCAVQILKAMLRSENILYRIECVGSVTELQLKLELLKGRDCRNYLFLNCASFKDMTSTWLGLPESGTLTYILDSRRPIHHSNVNSPLFWVIDDGSSGIDSCPLPEEFQLIEEGDEPLNNENEDLNEEEDESLQLNRKANMRRHQKDQRLLREVEQKIRDYYAGQHFGMSSALVMYLMSKEVNKEGNEFLWSAMVGTTSQLVDSRVSRQSYEEWKDKLKLDVTRFNEVGCEQSQEKIGAISQTVEFNFLLLRHWSLYDSLLHSRYIAKAFRLWREEGRRELDLSIARMGFTLEQSKQLFKFMRQSSRSRLKVQLRKLGENKGLYDLLYCSFVRRYDNHIEFSAADFCHLINCALETQPEREADLEARFWLALSSLDNYQSAENFLEAAKDYQRQIISAAVAALESRTIVRSATFSYYLLKADSQQRRLFQQHQSQVRLARCIMQFYNAERRARDKKNSYQELPFVLGIQFQNRDLTTVVGVVDANWVDSKNTFGLKFSQTAEDFKIESRQQFFQASIIQIKRSNFKSFMSGLNL